MTQEAKKIQEDRGLEEIIIEANGILAKSDTHEHPEIRRNSFRIASELGYMLLDGGDNVNDYQFGLIMQEAAANDNYRFNSQLENDFYSRKYNEGKLTKDEFLMYQITRIAEMNGLSENQVLDHLEHQGKYFDTNRDFTSEDKTRLENLLNSDLLSAKFNKLEQDFYNDKEVQAHWQRNFNLFYSFMDEEAQAYAADMKANPEVKVGMVLGNHDNLLFASLVKQYLDDPNQLIILGYDTDLLTVRQDNGQEITNAGATNCVSPFGYLAELLPPGVAQQFYEHMFRELTGDNVVKSNISLDELLRMNYKTPWYNSVMEKLNGRTLDVLTTHGPAESKFGHPYLTDVAVMSTKARKHIKGHNHYIGEEKSQYGVDTYTVAGEKSLILYKDETGEFVHEWVQVGTNYGDGMQLPMLHSARYYIDKANSMSSGLDKYLVSSDDVPQNSANDSSASSSKVA